MNKSQKKGSGAVEIVLWLMFLAPGLIYSVWRRSGQLTVCPSCGGRNLVPIDSPVGKQLLEKQGKTLEQAKEEVGHEIATHEKDRSMRFWVWIIGFVVLFLVVYFGASSL